MGGQNGPRQTQTCCDTPATARLRRGSPLTTLQPTKRQPATVGAVERGGRVTTAPCPPNRGSYAQPRSANAMPGMRGRAVLAQLVLRAHTKQRETKVCASSVRRICPRPQRQRTLLPAPASPATNDRIAQRACYAVLIRSVLDSMRRYLMPAPDESARDEWKNTITGTLETNAEMKTSLICVGVLPGLCTGTDDHETFRMVMHCMCVLSLLNSMCISERKFADENAADVSKAPRSWVRRGCVTSW
jgi:hypothetical protein